MLQTQSSKGKIKSVVMENYELEYRKNDKTDSTSLAFLNYEKSNTGNKKILTFKCKDLLNLKIVDGDFDEENLLCSYGKN